MNKLTIFASYCKFSFKLLNNLAYPILRYISSRSSCFYDFSVFQNTLISNKRLRNQPFTPILLIKERKWLPQSPLLRSCASTMLRHHTCNLRLGADIRRRTCALVRGIQRCSDIRRSFGCKWNLNWVEIISLNGRRSWPRSSVDNTIPDIVFVVFLIRGCHSYFEFKCLVRIGTRC